MADVKKKFIKIIRSEVPSTSTTEECFESPSIENDKVQSECENEVENEPPKKSARDAWDLLAEYQKDSNSKQKAAQKLQVKDQSIEMEKDKARDATDLLSEFSKENGMDGIEYEKDEDQDLMLEENKSREIAIENFTNKKFEIVTGSHPKTGRYSRTLLLCDITYDFLNDAIGEDGTKPDLALVHCLKLYHVINVLKCYLQKQDLDKGSKVLVVCMMRCSDAIFFRKSSHCQGYKHQCMKEPVLHHYLKKIKDFETIHDEVQDLAKELELNIDFIYSSMVPFNPLKVQKSLAAKHWKENNHKIKNVSKLFASSTRETYKYIKHCRGLNFQLRNNGMTRMANLPPWGFLSWTNTVFRNGKNWNLNGLPVIPSGYHFTLEAKLDIKGKVSNLLGLYNTTVDEVVSPKLVQSITLLGDATVKKLVDSWTSSEKLTVGYESLSINVNPVKLAEDLKLKYSESKTLFVVCLNPKKLLEIINLEECKKHKPMKFPKCKSNMMTSGTALLKEMDSVRAEVTKVLPKCCVTFTSVYQVDFKCFLSSLCSSHLRSTKHDCKEFFPDTLFTEQNELFLSSIKKLNDEIFSTNSAADVPNFDFYSLVSNDRSFLVDGLNLGEKSFPKLVSDFESVIERYNEKVRTASTVKVPVHERLGAKKTDANDQPYVEEFGESLDKQEEQDMYNDHIVEDNDTVDIYYEESDDMEKQNDEEFYDDDYLDDGFDDYEQFDQLPESFPVHKFKHTRNYDIHNDYYEKKSEFVERGRSSYGGEERGRSSYRSVERGRSSYRSVERGRSSYRGVERGRSSYRGVERAILHGRVEQEREHIPINVLPDNYSRSSYKANKYAKQSPPPELFQPKKAFYESFKESIKHRGPSEERFKSGTRGFSSHSRGYHNQSDRSTNMQQNSYEKERSRDSYHQYHNERSPSFERKHHREEEISNRIERNRGYTPEFQERRKSPYTSRRRERSSSYPDFGDYDHGKDKALEYDNVSSNDSFDGGRSSQRKMKKMQKRSRDYSRTRDSFSPPTKARSKALRKRSYSPANEGTSQAMETLRDIHEKECERYRENPTIHPAYKKEKSRFVQKMSQHLYDSGRDPFTCDLTKGFDRHFSNKLEELFDESWYEKKNKCLNMLQLNNHPKSKKRKETKDNDMYYNNLIPQSERYHGSSANSPIIKTSVIDLHHHHNKYNSNKRNSDMAIDNRPGPSQSYIPEPSINRQSEAPSKSKRGSHKRMKHNSGQHVNSFDIIETLTVLSQMPDKFGDLAIPLSEMFRSAIEMQKNGRDPLVIFKEQEFEVLRLAMKTLGHMRNQNLSLIQKAIVGEGHTRIEKLLSYLHEKLNPYFGLDVRSIARQIDSFSPSEALHRIKQIAANRGYFYIKDSEVFKIYVAAKKLD